MTIADLDQDPLFFAFQHALAGRYSIDRELGRGGMGVVYLAREVHLDRLVAIKLLPPERALTAGLRERFLGEARLAAKLSHPNIIPIHSVEERDGFVFYVMAFIDGETLTQRLRDRGPMPAAEGTRLMREVAWALAYAHGQGVVHRDVKPDNILIERSTSRVLVADFGIAAAAGDTGSEGVTGTPEFMSPEQALGGLIDGRSDLYGLGATAFFAFSGRLVFEGKNATEVLAKQVTAVPPTLDSLGLTVPRKLVHLIDRCLAKEPGRRPASAQLLAEELGVALEQRREVPVTLRAFVKRNGRIDGGGTLLASIAVLMSSSAVAYQFGGRAALGYFVGMTCLIPILYMTRAARNLMRMGYSYDDIAPAFKAEVDQNSEELAVQQLQNPGRVARHLPRAVKLAAATFVMTLCLTLVSNVLHVRLFALNVILGVTMLASSLMVIVSIISHIVVIQRTRDVDSEFWGSVWHGVIGRSAFSIAKRFLGKQRRASAMTHRATELSLGMAAEQLFESLPKESRRALGDLPGVLQRLQQDAQLLRKRYDQLQEGLSRLQDGIASAENADLVVSRDGVHAKLGETVAALETIRLNLLRLHAGAASVSVLTTHVGIARQVSEDVQRMIAAQREVDRMLGFPTPA